ncbi:Protein of unknown function [Gryllus bimaculatus]|nr:Protein of unknown function [Gryllus bimaculatus]
MNQTNLSKRGITAKEDRDMFGNTGPQLLQVLLLMVLTIVTFAIECNKPVIPDGCGGGCLVLDKDACIASNRTYIERGSICHCDICVKRVGEYQPCNYTVMDEYENDNEVYFGHRQTTVLCNLNLICTKNFNVSDQKDKMMCQKLKSMVYFVLLISVTASVAIAIECFSPLPPNQCELVDVACFTFNETDCTTAGGFFVAHGGVCGFCNLCVEFVDNGQRCNTSVKTFNTEDTPVTAICKHPLVCSTSNNGQCVNPHECEYSNS